MSMNHLFFHFIGLIIGIAIALGVIAKYHPRDKKKKQPEPRPMGPYRTPERHMGIDVAGPKRAQNTQIDYENIAPRGSILNPVVVCEEFALSFVPDLGSVNPRFEVKFDKGVVKVIYGTKVGSDGVIKAIDRKGLAP